MIFDNDLRFVKLL